MEESSLLCHENEYCFSGNDDDDEYCDGSGETEMKSNALLGFEDEEYIVSLIQREESEASVSRSPLPFEHSVRSVNWWNTTRSDSIEWILNARAFLGFHYQTSYVAVTYLDRFLARRSISDEKVWAMRLLSVSCLSLAAKMEERHVPALSNFPVQRYEFESRVIMRMELLILTTLDWQMGSVTPFSYINFFIDKLLGKTNNSKELFSASVELVLAALKEINLVDYRPSTIAAAAVLASSSGQLTRNVVELKIGGISSCGSLATEHVFACYNIMHEIQKKEAEKTPKEMIVFSPMATTSKGFSYGSANGNKRRRLQFNDNDDLSIPLLKHTDRQ